MKAELADPLAEMLERWRTCYAGRRTIAGQMLDEAREIILASIAYHEARHQDSVAAIKSANSDRVATLESTIDNQRETIDLLRKQLEDRRSLYEARRSVSSGEDAEITIRRDDHLKSWRIADLEEIAFRLRCGGGDDETAVDMESNRAVAVVPAPNLVQLEHRPAPPLLPLPPEFRQPAPEVKTRKRSRVPLLPLLLALLFMAVTFNIAFLFSYLQGG